MHPFPPSFLPFSYPWYGASGLLWNMVLCSTFFWHHIIWPLISFHHSFHPLTHFLFLHLPYLGSPLSLVPITSFYPFILSILSHIHLIHSFLSILFSHITFIQSSSSTHFTQIHLQSIFNSSNPFTSHQFYSYHYSSYHHHSSNLIHVHSSIRHKSKKSKKSHYAINPNPINLIL